MAVCQNWSRVTFIRLHGRQCIQNTLCLKTQRTTKSSQFTDGDSFKCKDNNLHRACREGRLTKVQRFLSTGYNINCRGRFRRTPVMQAALSGKVAVFDFLVSQRCDMSVVDKYNDAVIHLACRGSDIQIIRKILYLDKDQLERRGYNKRTPVMTAAAYCRKDVVDFLKRKHCNMSVVAFQKQNILHVACQRDCTNVVDYILSNGIQSIESRNKLGMTSLLIAAYYCESEVFLLLLTKGGNVTAYDNIGQNILHLACKSNCTVIVDYILSRDIISKESRDKYGRTALMLAAAYGHKEMVIFLLSKGCSVKAVDKNYNTILHVACFEGNTDVLKYLLTLKEMDWQKKNINGDTPIDIAKRKNIKSVVEGWLLV